MNQLEVYVWNTCVLKYAQQTDTPFKRFALISSPGMYALSDTLPKNKTKWKCQYVTSDTRS